MMKKIKVKYTATAPISHIGEVASIGSYFQTVQTPSGRIPVITGNSVRGLLRDAAAKHLLDKIGMKVNKEIFNVLFSGGNISGSMKLDVARAKNIREHFPAVSLFGGGVGTMIMGGKLLSGFLYPICKETAEMLHMENNSVSWHSLIDEIEFTRMDDAKNDKNEKYMEEEEEKESKKTKEASTQMRFSVQYMAPGTEFSQTMIILDGANDLEIGALYNAFAEWFRVPRIGGMSARGFGMFDAVVGDDDISVKDGVVTVAPEVHELVDKYNQFIIEDDSAKWLSVLGVK